MHYKCIIIIIKRWERRKSSDDCEDAGNARERKTALFWRWGEFSVLELRERETQNGGGGWGARKKNASNDKEMELAQACRGQGEH